VRQWLLIDELEECIYLIDSQLLCYCQSWLSVDVQLFYCLRVRAELASCCLCALVNLLPFLSLSRHRQRLIVPSFPCFVLLGAFFVPFSIEHDRATRTLVLLRFGRRHVLNASIGCVEMARIAGFAFLTGCRCLVGVVEAADISVVVAHRDETGWSVWMTRDGCW
jgi:hypothetical protein